MLLPIALLLSQQAGSTHIATIPVLFKSSKKIRAHPLGLISCCLDADWDLLISVHQLLSFFPSSPTVEHIEGHQDRNTSYDSLDVVSQMNVDADTLATLELKEYGSILPAVPFDPICKVLLHINGRTITGDISTAIQHSLFAPKLQEYQCSRFGWSVLLHNTIDWEIFSQVYSSYPRSRKFFYQFGWKKLPVGRRLHSRESRFDDRCPVCLQPDKSDDHLFQCLHQDS